MRGRSVVRIIPWEQVFRVRGTPVLMGAFGMEKAESIPTALSRVLRLIINMIPLGLSGNLAARPRSCCGTHASSRMTPTRSWGPNVNFMPDFDLPAMAMRPSGL